MKSVVLMYFSTAFKGVLTCLKLDSFDNIKAALCSDSVLRHYDPMAELVLQCDASSVGVAVTRRSGKQK